MEPSQGQGLAGYQGRCLVNGEAFLLEVSALIEKRLTTLDAVGGEPVDTILVMTEVLLDSIYLLSTLMMHMTGDESQTAADAFYQRLLQGALDQAAAKRSASSN